MKPKRRTHPQPSIDCHMRAIVSIGVVTSALYVILSGTYHNAEQNWAFGVVGAVMGYWFKR